MKILAPDLLGDREALDRFELEVRITARLQHPGIVAVFDRGTLADGRPWYTMSEVRGRTFGAIVLEARANGLDDPGLRRLLALLQRACEAVGYAHGQGVVHRDLKPENILVGAFGEVQVVDWGLARREGDPSEPERRAEEVDTEILPTITRRGAVLGTPSYMAPEQARGEPVGPSADVYALGGVLLTVLTGRPPLEGLTAERLVALGRGALRPRFPEDTQVPAALAEVCHLALAFAPTERYPDARVLGLALGEWLDGARRRAEADAILEEARSQRPRIDAARRKAESIEREAASVLEGLPRFAPVDEKRHAWALEDAATALRREAALMETAWLQTVRSALNLEPELPAAHDVLADHYAVLLLDAEARRKRDEAVTLEALLRSHDRGRHRALLAGEETVSLVTDPPDAEVEVWRFEARDRRLVPLPTGRSLLAPLHEVALPLGSYLLLLRAPGRAVVPYPVVLERGRPWSGVRPGGRTPAPIYLPRPEELGPDDCYVPAGPARIGGDPDAGEGLARRDVWIDGFVLRRHPVTHGAYVRFLDALVARGREQEALACAPRRIAFAGAAEAVPVRYARAGDGSFRLDPTLDECAPVTMVDWRSAAAYTRWEAERTGEPWRLPDELEWEKAARGVDGRFFAWGDQPEPTWANLIGSSAEPREARPVGSHPVDRSVYGVEGLMGNVRDWCGNAWSPQGPPVRDGIVVVEPATLEDERLRAMRGGAWQSVVSLARAAVRFAGAPDQRLGPTGFRLARSLG